MTALHEFKDGNSWGILTSIDLHDCDPELVRSAKDIEKFVRELCDLIEVTRFGECQIVHFGEKEEIAGFSMTQLIETSLVSGHFVNSTNAIFLDVFSCKYYDPEVVTKKAEEFFKSKSSKSTYLIRK